jgi:hypothetical protein
MGLHGLLPLPLPFFFTENVLREPQKSSHHTENTLPLYYKRRLLYILWNCHLLLTRPINTRCEHNAVLYIKVGGAYSYHCA